MRLRFAWLGLVFSLGIVFPVFGASADRDSLQQAVAAASPANRPEALFTLGKSLIDADALDTAVTVLEQAYVEALAQDQPILAAMCQTRLGLISYRQRDYILYTDYALQVEALYRHYGVDSSLHVATYNVALAYKKLGLLDSAMVYMERAIALSYAQDDEELLNKVLLTAGNLYRQQEDYAQAEEYLLRAYTYYQRQNDSTKFSQALNNLGNLYLYSNRAEEALPWFYQALAYKQALGSPQLAYYNLGLTYTRLARHDSAVYFHQQALARRTSALDSAYSYRALGLAWLLVPEYSKARAYLDQARELLPNDGPLQLQKEIFQGLREVAEGVGDLQAALAFQDSVMACSERIEQASSVETAAIYRQRFELQDLENMRDRIALELEVEEEKNLRNRLVILGLIILALAAGVALFFAYRSYKLEQQAKSRIADVLQELHHRLKNHLQSVTGLIQVQRAKVKESEAMAVLKTVHDQIAAINMIHTNLYQGSEEQLADVNLETYVEELVGNILLASQVPYQPPVLSLSPMALDVGQAVPLGLIINEVVTNATKYGRSPDTQSLALRVLLSQSEGILHLHISDQGPGMHGGAAAEETVGLALIKKLAGQLRATYTVSPPPGLTFSLQLKLS